MKLLVAASVLLVLTLLPLGMVVVSSKNAGDPCDNYGNCIFSSVSYIRSNPDHSLYLGDEFAMILSTSTGPNTTSVSFAWSYDAAVLSALGGGLFQVVGNASGIYAFAGQGGNLLWSRALNHTIISLSISANGGLIAAGGYQLQGGPATAVTFTNGGIYLFNSTTGKLLWNKDTGSENPVFKVMLSADGSMLAVDTESNIMLLEGQQGNTIWSYATGGNTVGLGMSADGSLVVASMGPTIAAFNDQGTMVWSHPGMVLAVSTDSVAVSSYGSYVWVGSAVDGYNGSLYLFNKQRTLLWQRQIYSPVLSIQTGGNLTAFVSTNFGALLYGADGSLLQNITDSSPVVHSDCTYLPAFWYWGGDNQTAVTFFDSQGDAISSYNPGDFTGTVALSSDGNYAAIVSQQGLGANSSFSLAFVYLRQASQSCIHD